MSIKNIKKYVKNFLHIIKTIVIKNKIVKERAKS